MALLRKISRARTLTAGPKITPAAMLGKSTIASTTQAPFVATQLRAKAKIPMVTYEGGQRHEELLTPATANTVNPVNPPGQDDEKMAYALQSSISRHLTPTMSKFTLMGKVAVITG